MDFVMFGDGLWATLSLRRLLEDGHRARALVMRRKPSELGLERLAEELGIPIARPERVNDPSIVAWVRLLGAPLCISMSYDQIIHRPLFESAPLGFINCHAGKLPYYRGRNVINWAIINNESEIGLTVHYMDEGIDTGDVILQTTLPLEWEDTYDSVLRKVTEACPELLAKAVRLIEEGRVRRQAQDHLDGTYFAARVSGDEWIDWNDSSLNIYNKIRAITRPGPGARTILEGRELILWQARYDRSWPKYIAVPGEVVGLVSAEGVKVKTGDSTIILQRAQFVGEAEQQPAFRIGTRLGLNAMSTLLHLQGMLEDVRKACAHKAKE